MFELIIPEGDHDGRGGGVAAGSWGGGVAAGGWSRKLQTGSEGKELKVGKGYKFSKTTLNEIIPLPKRFITSQTALPTRDHVFTYLSLLGHF